LNSRYSEARDGMHAVFNLSHHKSIFATLEKYDEEVGSATIPNF